MSMTRDEYITEIRHIADAESDGRWPTPRVVASLDLAFRREWRGILNANPDYRLSRRDVTTDADGRVDIADLSINSGLATAEGFYRIRTVSVGDCEYRELTFADAPGLATATSSSLAQASQSFYRIGDQIQLSAPANTAAVVWVNHLPLMPKAAADGSVTLTFPDDYEQVVCYEAAALLLSKGGTETDAAMYFKALSEEARRDMLGDIARVSTNPTKFRYSDSRSGWGG